MKLILDSVNVTMATGAPAVKMNASVEATTPAMEMEYATQSVATAHAE